MQDSFRIGDKAVYPARGVVEVTGLETKEISGHKTQFYILQTLANGDNKPQKIMVPVSNAATVFGSTGKVRSSIGARFATSYATRRAPSATATYRPAIRSTLSDEG